MKQAQFESQNQAMWQEYDELMGIARNEPQNPDLYRLPELYKKLCGHYALANSRYYSRQLVADLHRRVREGHDILYRSRQPWFWNTLWFVIYGFPAQLRSNFKLFAIAFVLFFGTGMMMATAVYHDSEYIYSVMSHRQVADMESMYNPNNDRIGRSSRRQADTNFLMFGYYIKNNISIGFQSFALGLLFGLGTAMILVYNGLVIGAVAGYLTRLGYNDTFWPFVSGHSALELIGIVVSGAAGLRLAQAILQPGNLTRLAALKLAGKESVQLVLGAAIMLTLAAFIEAFWSALPFVTNELKIAVGVSLWVAVFAYFYSLGRHKVGLK